MRPAPPSVANDNRTREADEAIRREVIHRFTLNPNIDAPDLQVGVCGGEVTMAGTVADQEAKLEAQNIASAVQGVKSVRNLLVTREPGGSTSARPGSPQRQPRKRSSCG